MTEEVFIIPGRPCAANPSPSWTGLVINQSFLFAIGGSLQGVACVCCGAAFHVSVGESLLSFGIEDLLGDAWSEGHPNLCPYFFFMSIISNSP